MSKRRRGVEIRPCYVCGSPVNFTIWDSETQARQRRIFHWANPDGSHHIHAERGLPVRYEHRDDLLDFDQASHLREILTA